MNAKIKVMLRTPKVNSKGESPIVFRITQNRKVTFLFTSHWILPKYWDEKESTPKSSFSKYKGIMEDLTLTWTKLVRLLNDGYTPEIACKIIKKPTDPPVIAPPIPTILYDTPPVFSYIQRLKEQLLESGRVGYSQAFRDLYTSLLKFHPTELKFEEITFKFLTDYETFLLKNGCTLNTVYVYMRHLKVVVNRIRKEKLIHPDWYPFKEFNFGRYTKIETTKRALSLEDFDTFEAYQPSQPGLVFAQHIFLFSFYCRGINFKDIALLKRGNIVNGRIQYIRAKTHKPFSVKLLPAAQEILHYYLERMQDNEYIFPILHSKKHREPQQIEWRLERMNKKINSGIRSICKLVGIRGNVTTYAARHSFATILYHKGMSTAMISELLGHSTEETTRIYLKSFGDSELDDAVEKLL